MLTDQGIGAKRAQPCPHRVCRYALSRPLVLRKPRTHTPTRPCEPRIYQNTTPSDLELEDRGFSICHLPALMQHTSTGCIPVSNTDALAGSTGPSRLLDTNPKSSSSINSTHAVVQSACLMNVARYETCISITACCVQRIASQHIQFAHRYECGNRVLISGAIVSSCCEFRMAYLSG